MKTADKITQQFGNNLRESLTGVASGQGSQTEQPATVQAVNKFQGSKQMKNAGEMDIDRIMPDPNQPRKTFDQDSLELLAESIKTYGLLQPISIRYDEKKNRWLIVAGERRWRASKVAGKKTIPCIFTEMGTEDPNIRVTQLIENIHREDLNPLDKARAIQELIDRERLSIREVARRVHLNASNISRILCILELPPDVQEQVAAGTLAASTASEISKASTDEDQRMLAAQVVAQKLSTKKAAEVVRTKTGRQPKRKEAEEEGPKSQGTTVAYHLPLGKVSLTSDQKPFRVVEQLALAEQLITTLKTELAFKASHSEAA
jgi:ParB family transcriptional regulator, chromosome partitioning protein